MDTHQMLTHTSCSSGQMAVISHSTLQVFLPAQLVSCTSQNLHSLRIFIAEDSGKREKREKQERSGLNAGTRRVIKMTLRLKSETDNRDMYQQLQQENSKK